MDNSNLRPINLFMNWIPIDLLASQLRVSAQAGNMCNPHKRSKHTFHTLAFVEKGAKGVDGMEDVT